mgnify:CR=1 FL=1
MSIDEYGYNGANEGAPEVHEYVNYNKLMKGLSAR